MTSAAQKPGIANSVVSRALRALRTCDTAARRRGGGRPRTTTLRYDRYIVQQARRDPRQSASLIAMSFNRSSRQAIPRTAVAKRRHGCGLFARRPLRGVSLPLVIGETDYGGARTKAEPCAFPGWEQIQSE
ncbi:hypothetical protein V3C99_009541 [Haemonchus contortus]